jgi:drug/metabolite transporter (DMT)-like permease
MKLNFWQILGLIMIIVAVVFIARRKMSPTATTLPTTTQSP